MMTMKYRIEAVYESVYEPYREVLEKGLTLKEAMDKVTSWQYIQFFLHRPSIYNPEPRPDDIIIVRDDGEVVFSLDEYLAEEEKKHAEFERKTLEEIREWRRKMNKLEPLLDETRRDLMEE
jgi:hypothetical protein